MDGEAKRLPTMAELKSKPTKALEDFASAAQQLSTCSCSTVRKDFACSDGVLVVSSHDGGLIEYTCEPPPGPLPGEV